MSDLETIIVLVILAFNFIPQRDESHKSLTLPMSRFRYSATAPLAPGDGTTGNKAESSVLPISLLSRMEKGSEVYWRNNNGPTIQP